MENVKQYMLLHKDIPAVLLNIDPDTGNMVSYQVVNEKHAPFEYNNKRAFNNWWERRAIPKNQKNSQILIDNETNMTYMLNNLSLSLVDNYWICPAEENFYWDNINLYAHNFAEIDFSFSDLNNISPFKPSATTQGELQKRWVIKSGERYLVKGNYGASYRQSINEVLATCLHNKQGKECVNYELISLPTTMGKGIGCISKNFTSENLEFIPAYDVTFAMKKDNSISEYQSYINTCAEYGLDKDDVQNFMDYMIMSDFLLTNTDRHLLNMGVLRDPVNLNFVKMAPLFDTGNSMFYNTTYSEEDISNIAIKSFYKTEEKMLDQVKNREALDLNLLPTVSEIRKLYSADPYSVVYMQNMTDGYEKKIELLNGFQKGYSVNPRSKNYYAKFM